MTIKEHIGDMRLSQLLAREFQKTSNQFYLYSEYCTAYYKAVNLLQMLYTQRPGLEDFVSFLSHDPRAKGLDLFSYLIKPVQVRPLASLNSSASASIPSSSPACCRTWSRTTPSAPTSRSSTARSSPSSPPSTRR